MQWLSNIPKSYQFKLFGKLLFGCIPSYSSPYKIKVGNFCSVKYMKIIYVCSRLSRFVLWVSSSSNQMPCNDNGGLEQESVAVNRIVCD